MAKQELTPEEKAEAKVRANYDKIIKNPSSIRCIKEENAFLLYYDIRSKLGEEEGEKFLNIIEKETKGRIKRVNFYRMYEDCKGEIEPKEPEKLNNLVSLLEPA